MNECTNELKNDWMKVWMSLWTFEWAFKWLYERIYIIKEYLNEWIILSTVKWVHECIVNTLKIITKLKKYSQCIITVDNDNDYANDLWMYSHFIWYFPFFLVLVNCEWYEMNEWFTLTALIRGPSSVCEYVRIIMRICFPSFSLSAVDSTPPTPHEMTWLRCESKTGAKWLAKKNKMKMKWKKGIKEWNNLPNERSTEKWQGNQQLLSEEGEGRGKACMGGSVYKGCDS